MRAGARGAAPVLPTALRAVDPMRMVAVNHLTFRVIHPLSPSTEGERVIPARRLAPYGKSFKKQGWEKMPFGAGP